MKTVFSSAAGRPSLDERFHPEFKAVCEERYGLWRPAIATAVAKFLECGDLQQGFARVRCAQCACEFFVAYSCRGRCFCPSCHQKRALQTATWVAERVCAVVPHRQFVFTMPKRLRVCFRFDRRLLGELCRAAWRVVGAIHAGLWTENSRFGFKCRVFPPPGSREEDAPPA